MESVTTDRVPGWLQAAVRRAAVPLALGVACLVASWPATEDLDPLLKGLALILLALGLVIVVATSRTLMAEERRMAARPRGPSQGPGAA